jgi:DNA-binding transcriptional ArsR family regulator
LTGVTPVAIFTPQVEYMTPALNGTFAALSDPTRREIVQRLAKGAARVTDLAQPFDMSLNAISKHVKVLERAGLVRRTRAGREHHIALDPEPIRRIAGWASRYERFWSDRLDKLEAFLTTNRKGD